MPALLLSCKNYKRNTTHKDVPLSSIKKGEVLAIKYCQSCHLLPDPSMLDTKSWEKGILPNMGPRLGIFYYGFNTYPSYKTDKFLDSGFYPSEPVLNMEEWQNIIDYYTATSPDTLTKQDRKQSIQQSLSLFSVLTPKISYNSPALSFTKINQGDSLYPLVISDVSKKIIYFCNKQLEIKDSVNSSGPIIDIDFSENQMLFCNIGVLNPNNGKFGKGSRINIDSKGRMREDSIALFDSLRRPVQIISADLNNDNKKDYIVCEFGNLTGALSWMENLGNNKFTRHELRSLSGAIKAYVNDYNYDGAEDIWVLFAQGEEGVFLFTNKGQGKFESRQVLRFPSVYGSSYFELADFNKDGYPDIVYTCGDNADFSPILKPYHGVYIFINDGKNNFEQKYFYPINGCYKAMARDFDGDGDLDIASIAFFPDFEHQAEEGFVYLEQQKEFDFKPYTLPECKTGRWLTMDAGDLDGDGKIDLLLGNFSIKPSAMPSEIDWKKGPVFLFLKNESK
jgi:hypothetical protein